MTKTQTKLKQTAADGAKRANPFQVVRDGEPLPPIASQKVRIRPPGRSRARKAQISFEPDCCPLQTNWIELLQKEYDERSKPVVGNVHDQEAEGGIPRHINGNAMFPVWLAKDWPHLLETPITTAWDFHHREFINSQAQDTNLITSYYRRKLLTEPEWKTVSKNGVRPALLHGVKDATARGLARTHLLRGRNPAKVPSVLGSRVLRGPG